MKELTSILIVLFCSASIVFAQTQTQLNQSSNENFSNSDQQLNALYQKILKEYASDTVFIRKIKAAEQLWIQFRDAQVEARYPDARIVGSSTPMCVAAYKDNLTQQRIKELQLWIEGIPEGDVCTGTVRMKK